MQFRNIVELSLNQLHFFKVASTFTHNPQLDCSHGLFVVTNRFAAIVPLARIRTEHVLTNGLVPTIRFPTNTGFEPVPLVLMVNYSITNQRLFLLDQSAASTIPPRGDIPEPFYLWFTSPFFV